MMYPNEYQKFTEFFSSIINCSVLRCALIEKINEYGNLDQFFSAIYHNPYELNNYAPTSTINGAQNRIEKHQQIYPHSILFDSKLPSIQFLCRNEIPYFLIHEHKDSSSALLNLCYWITFLTISHSFQHPRTAPQREINFIFGRTLLPFLYYEFLHKFLKEFIPKNFPFTCYINRNFTRAIFNTPYQHLLSTRIFIQFIFD